MGPSERSSTLFDISASSICLHNGIMSGLWGGLVSSLFNCKLWVQGLSLFIWAMRTASFWGAILPGVFHRAGCIFCA